MSKQVVKTDTNEIRQGLRKLASEIMDKFAKEKSALANYYNIKGSGKDLFLIDALIPALDTQGILHDDIINIAEESDQTKILDASKKIAEWVYSNILKSKSKISNDLSGLEKDFFTLREKLSAKKDKPLFAILINDINNLPFDDLDWFQSVVLEALVSSRGSIVVVTSQNEINWHSWEMRNKCESKKIPAFSFEEILDLCESHPLAQKILELSAGHPKTVQSLVNLAKQKNALSSFSEEDVNDLSEEFVDILKREIDENLYFFKEKDQWLRDAFYLISAADGFDADLASDIIAEFNKRKDEKEKIIVPEDVTDVAWEMAYTGLAAWDFDEKTYKIVPELRERVVRYMEHKETDHLYQVSETIAKSYLLRADVLPNWVDQLIKYIQYTNEPLNSLQKSINEFLKTNEDDIVFLHALRKENSVNPKSIFQKLLQTYDIPATSIIPSDSRMFSKEEIKMNEKAAFDLYPKTSSRSDIKEQFKKFLRDEGAGGWVFHIQGENGGIGKTHLMRSLKEYTRDQRQTVVEVDFHSPASRNVLPVLREIINQAGIADNAKINIALETLDEEITDKNKSNFSAESSKEQFDRPYVALIEAIRDAFLELAVRPNIFIDTLDIGSIELTRWFLPKLMDELKNVARFIIAGRLPVTNLIKSEYALKIESFKIGPLSKSEIEGLITLLEGEGVLGIPVKLPNEIIIWASEISEGNPLIFIWVLFYLMEFENKDTWLQLSKLEKNSMFKYIAEKIFILDFDTPLVEKNHPERMIALQAAAHFGSHFNLEIFSKSVPVHALGSYSHEEVYNNLNSKFFYYIRGTDKKDYWTLHDAVREWLIDSYAEHYFQIPSSLKKLSRNALDNYYSPKIEKLLENDNRTISQQELLDNLKVEQFYHRLLVEVDPQKPEKPLQYHRDLWNYLDYLWDHYFHYQMHQLIQYGSDLRRWKIPHSDLLLSDILHAAQAWLSYAQTDYTTARVEAEMVRKNSPHRRLKATANAVIGLIPSADPEEALNKLKLARNFYKELVDELSSNQVWEDEFTDKPDKIYPELHLVLMSIGRAHLRSFDNLKNGIDALEEAYKNSKKVIWKKPLYSAVALNEWARILRFQGDYSDALNKVMAAIFIYKKERKHPEYDANFGYFYETLGLIYKELGQFDQAQAALDFAGEVYKKIPNILETRKATITLEKGHVYFLNKENSRAFPLLRQAHEIFSKDIDKNPSYYLSTINKLGEYHLAQGEYEKAKEYFNEQKKTSERYNHRFWLYLAEQSLAEVNYKASKSLDKELLERLLVEYSVQRSYQLGPAYWRTKHLLYTAAKEENNQSLAISHLTKGLTYLSEHWRGLFWKNLVLLRNELLELEAESLENELTQVINIWKQELNEGDPTHPFIQTFETIKEALR